MKRIFLVGAPRSGTTILQSLLAAHPEVISFPESKFFHYLLYDQFAGKLPGRMEAFFKDEIKRPELLKDFDDTQTVEAKASWFVRVLDGLAAEQKKSIWLEKTPEHIYFIDDIQRFLPDAKFIHILRNGMDTIASMYEATRNFNELWGAGWDLNHCIDRWEHAMLTSHKYINKLNHILVKYEDLLDNKTQVLGKICNFMGIEYDDRMLVNYQEKAANLSLNLPWHKGIERDVKSSNVHKYHKIFTRKEIRYILDKIQRVNEEMAWKVTVEVTERISDIYAWQICDRLCCTITLEGIKLGIIELPICDCMVAAGILADAIAAQFAWPILDRFFQRNRCEKGNKLWETLLEPLHPKHDWTLFMQELWGRPHWHLEDFYKPEIAEEVSTITIEKKLIVLEISEKFANIKVELSEIDVLVKVGGVAVGVVTVAVENNFVSAQKLRSTITRNMGFELCIAAVREALLGKPLNGKQWLRSRLASCAQQRSNLPDCWNAPGAGGIYPPNAVMFGRRSGAIGTSVSRRASLPAAALQEIESAAAIAGEPTRQIPPENEFPKQVFYVGEPTRQIPPENEFPKQVFYAPEIICSKSSYREVSHSVKPQVFDNHSVTQKLPILSYRRISADGLDAVTPQIFEQQLHNLKNLGYYSASLENWRSAKQAKTPLPGKAVLMTFDGGYLDFFQYAWPLLKRFDFTATVFLVAESIGKTNSWEKAEFEEVPLMGWPEILQLRDAGIEFGSMSATHQPLTALSPTEIVREAAKSRAILERGLEKPVKCFAYPYGDVDPIVAHLIGATGYTFGVSYTLNFSSFDDALLSLPRIQVTAENALKLA
ncbi:polysaccharide deacetylase [Microcoleus vaginatus PCC 9802]|uniref:sulfotransferase n=1 Tax=Microcoleus vaginatus TaxID=119532 RepID=UPI00020D2B88|nr:polysaccharide deacetylase [Microcoleus vaginatus FGP-2]UNU18095.1 polysaccharide deacetylase [Microcoleus vaginatus PCC 9802]